MAPVNGTTLKRIHREIRDLEKEDMGGITLAPFENNLFQWKASIPGPEGSPYEGGVFNLTVELAKDYPFSAPKVVFTTRIYHMNISERGSVCIDILKHNWSPALSLYKVLLSLSSLLTDPNPRDPLVPSIATEYARNRKKHDNTAREWTQLYAQVPKPDTSHTFDATGKGKGKVSTVPSGQGSSAQLHSHPSRVQNGVGASTLVRTRPPVAQRINPGVVEPDVALGTSSQSSYASVTAGKRKYVGGGDEEEPATRRRKREAGGSGRANAAEVIVIDD